MTRGSISGSLSGANVDVFVDMGNPFLNRTVDGFLKIGTVGMAKAGVEEAYQITRHGNISRHRLEHSLKKMCKEGAFWGSAAGLYVGAEFGVARIRGTHDWKNAMIGGALAGAVVSVATNSNNKDRIINNAIVGGALATASVFVNYLTQA